MPGTTRSAPFARPSLYLTTAGALVFVSALVALSAEVGSGAPAALASHGWVALDHADCAGLRAGSYYELANEDSAVELFVLPAGALLASRLPLPEPPYECREIPFPHFVEEIR